MVVNHLFVVILLNPSNLEPLMLMKYAHRFFIFILLLVPLKKLDAQTSEPLHFSRFQAQSSTLIGINGAYQLTGMQIRSGTRTAWTFGARNDYFIPMGVENRFADLSRARAAFYTNWLLRLDREAAKRKLELYLKVQMEVINGYCETGRSMSHGTVLDVFYRRCAEFSNFTVGLNARYPLAKRWQIMADFGLAAESDYAKPNFAKRNNFRGLYAGVGLGFSLPSTYDFSAERLDRFPADAYTVSLNVGLTPELFDIRAELPIKQFDKRQLNLHVGGGGDFVFGFGYYNRAKRGSLATAIHLRLTPSWIGNVNTNLGLELGYRRRAGKRGFWKVAYYQLVDRSPDLPIVAGYGIYL